MAARLGAVCVCMNTPASCVFVNASIQYCVSTLPYRVQLCILCAHAHVHTSAIVLSGSDRVTNTVCERGGSREKIAALQPSSRWWLLTGDYTVALLSTWKNMNRTTNTEHRNTAWQLESDTAWWTFIFIKDKIDNFILNRFHSPPNALVPQ